MPPTRDEIYTSLAQVQRPAWAHRTNVDAHQHRRLAYDRRGANTEALSTYMGHATIGIIMERYAHLMPGNGPHAACGPTPPAAIPHG